MTKTMTAALFAAALALTPALLSAHCGHCGMGDDDKKTEGKHEHPKAEGKGAMKAHAMPMVAGEAVSLKGEVVDMACFMSHDGKSEKHDCAKACLMNGVPAGLLGADGSITLLLEDHGAKKAFNTLKELGGKQAEVKGKKVVKAGVTALLVTEVKKG